MLFYLLDITNKMEYFPNNFRCLRWVAKHLAYLVIIIQPSRIIKIAVKSDVKTGRIQVLGN